MPDRKMERECFLSCPQCHGRPYVLFRRQVVPGSEVFEHLLWPAHPDVPPPSDPAKVVCPQCGCECVREH